MQHAPSKAAFSSFYFFLLSLFCLPLLLSPSPFLIPFIFLHFPFPNDQTSRIDYTRLRGRNGYEMQDSNEWKTH